MAGSWNKGLTENSMQGDLVFCVCVFVFALTLVLWINYSRIRVIIHIYLCFEIVLEKFHPHETQVHVLYCKA